MSDGFKLGVAAAKWESRDDEGKLIDSFSVVIISRDAASTIASCLDSVKTVQDVVLFDNGSSDQTIELAQHYPNVRVIQGDFIGFGPTKNQALDFANRDWVLALDTDERVTTELLDSLVARRPTQGVEVFEIERRNFFMGRWVRRGGWGNDRLVRFFNRRFHRFSQQAVHEKVVLHRDSNVMRINGAIEHLAVRELSDLLEKVNRYSSLSRGKETTILSPGSCFFRALLAFAKSYLFQLGCLEGWRGLVIAVSNFNGVFFKYMKAFVGQSR